MNWLDMVEAAKRLVPTTTDQEALWAMRVIVEMNDPKFAEEKK